MAKQSSVKVVNTQIVNSLPLDTGLKRYLVKWYARMCRCNGRSYAASVMKSLRELLMQFIADSHRREKLGEYILRAPIRKNRRIRELFMYAECYPHAVLALTKMYVSEANTLVTVEESEAEMHHLLGSITRTPVIPPVLKNWLKVLNSDTQYLKRRYNSALRDKSDPFHYVVSNHTKQDWLSYWFEWRRRLIIGMKNAYRSAKYENSIARVPVACMYADAVKDGFGEVTSESLSEDIQMFLEYFPDSDGEQEFVPIDILDWITAKEDCDRIFNLYELDDFICPTDADSRTVGRIHHIPKKGTVKRRPIAVPNRFLQKGLLPYQEALYRVLRRLPRDHTFDQTKSSAYIQNRLNKGFYTCSVDLSHATDYLPKGLADYIVDQLLVRVLGTPEGRILNEVFDFGPRFVKYNEDFELSRKLFDFMSRAPWKNGEFLDSWKVGQPLGTLPSFGTLALEHNVLLEAVALNCGYLHSPYTVLGDDVLLFSKRMRRAYLELMATLGVPISIHKSYEHNLVEFAGQIAVRNQPISYSPDHQKVTWYNLFDYSRNSGFLLSYHELPRGIRKKLRQKGARCALSGEKFYRLAAELYFAYYGSPYSSYTAFAVERLPSFVLYILSNEHVEPESEQTSGWTRFTDRNGVERLAYTGRGLNRKIDTDDWYKKKYKPASTNTIVDAAIFATTMYESEKSARNI